MTHANVSRTEADFARHVDYIHWDPVKHGQVRQAAGRPCPPFRRNVRPGVCAEDRGGMAGMSGDFAE